MRNVEIVITPTEGNQAFSVPQYSDNIQEQEHRSGKIRARSGGFGSCSAKLIRYPSDRSGNQSIKRTLTRPVLQRLG